MTPPGVRARPWHSAPASVRSGFLPRCARLACSCSPPEQGSCAPKNILPRWPAPRRSESPRQMYAAPPPAFPLAGSATAESPACTSGPSAETFAPIRDTRICRLVRFQTAVPRAPNRQPASETKPTQAAPREKTRSANPARKSAHPLWDRTPRTHDRETGARHGYSRRHFRCVRPVVVQHLRLHRRQERLGELRKVAVRSLQRAAPKNKIGNQRQHHQKQREHARVPKREPYPHRVKHGFSCLARYPWPAHAALPPRGSPLRLRPPRQKNTPRPVACAAAASLHGCQFFAARGSRTPRSDSKTDRSSRPTRARQFPPGPPHALRCAPEIPAAHIPSW